MQEVLWKAKNVNNAGFPKAVSKNSVWSPPLLPGKASKGVAQSHLADHQWQPHCLRPSQPVHFFSTSTPTNKIWMSPLILSCLTINVFQWRWRMSRQHGRLVWTTSPSQPQPSERELSLQVSFQDIKWKTVKEKMLVSIFRAEPSSAQPVCSSLCFSLQSAKDFPKCLWQNHKTSQSSQNTKTWPSLLPKFPLSNKSVTQPGAQLSWGGDGARWLGHNRDGQ